MAFPHSDFVFADTLAVQSHLEGFANKILSALESVEDDSRANKGKADQLKAWQDAFTSIAGTSLAFRSVTVCSEVT